MPKIQFLRWPLNKERCYCAHHISISIFKTINKRVRKKEKKKGTEPWMQTLKTPKVPLCIHLIVAPHAEPKLEPRLNPTFSIG